MSDLSKAYEYYLANQGEDASAIDFIISQPLHVSEKVTINPAEYEECLEIAEMDEVVLELLAGFGVKLIYVRIPDTEPALGLEIIPGTVAEEISNNYPDDDKAARMSALWVAIDDWIHGRLEENWGHLLVDE